MKIGDIDLGEGAILAPMAGFTEPGFRAVCARIGAGLTVTEMVSAKGLIHNGEKTLELLHTSQYEKISAVQIFGSDPEVMAQAVQSPYLEKFDIIDINMGCPVNKVVKNGEGSALMKNLPLASKIISAVKAAAQDRPVTVKFRLGWDRDTKNYIDFGKMCQDSGADALTLHARTRADFYSGRAKIEAWEKLKNAVSIPVIANGDIKDKQSYRQALDWADGVMIGRGALGYPQIFADVLDKSVDLTLMEAVLMHINELLKYFEPERAAINFRKHAHHYLKGVPNSREIKNKINQTDDINQVIELLKSAL
jgi:tRNA-dihydrouridine synthase B